MDTDGYEDILKLRKKRVDSDMQERTSLDVQSRSNNRVSKKSPVAPKTKKVQAIKVITVEVV